MKHIESILPENVADELTQFLLDDATISSALKDLLHRDTGCYIPSLDNVLTSDIEEIIPLCLSILRRFWNTPLTALGDGTEKQNLADIFQKVIGDRVQGNEAWSIPAANANIPTAVSALLQRDMSSGLTLTFPTGSASLPDGLSLAQLLCGKEDFIGKVVEIIDNNIGWTMTKEFPWSTFPNVKRVTLGCDKLIGYILNDVTLNTLQELNISDATYYEGDFAIILPNGALVAPKLTEVNVNLAYGQCFPLAKVIYFPRVTKLYGYNRLWQIGDLSILQKIVLGSLDNFGVGRWDWVQGDASNLMHMEYGADGGVGLQVSQDLSWWTATNVLSKPEFLLNFQTYIADRVADRIGKEALTLTLSPAVYEALEAQEGQTILATLANKNWNVAQA